MVFVHTNTIADALFNISLPEGRDAPVPLMWEGALRLQDRSIPVLNMGGGVRQGDSVAQSKHHYGARVLPLRCLKQVYLPDRFAELCRAPALIPQIARAIFRHIARSSVVTMYTKLARYSCFRIVARLSWISRRRPARPLGCKSVSNLLNTNLHADLTLRQDQQRCHAQRRQTDSGPGCGRRAHLDSKGAALPPAPADFPPRTIRRLEHYSEAIRTMGRENQYHPGTSEGATAGFDIWCRVKNRKVRPFK